MGISKTKNLARYYVWWPKIDEDIETLVKSCEPYQLNRNDPDKHSSHSWQHPAGPWQPIHIDYCGPKRPQKLNIKIQNINTNIVKQCPSIQNVNQYSFEIIILKINGKLA